jgi:hypothetical protein
VIPEEDKAPREPPAPELEGDVLAERRARRAWLSSPALARRAEAAEAAVHTLEAHLADLRRRQLEAERQRELATTQLAERELELRRVKQREYAEQQLRVEAEEAAVRLRRGHRAELDRMQRRAEEARAAAQHAEEQRDALAARLAGVAASCSRLQRGVAALQSAVVELRASLERDHQAAQARIRELEHELERVRAVKVQPPSVSGVEGSQPAEAQPAEGSQLAGEAQHAEGSQPTQGPQPAGEAQHAEGSQLAQGPQPAEGAQPEDLVREDALRRQEMAGALADAVERLRARVAAVEPPQATEHATGRSMQAGGAGGARGARPRQQAPETPAWLTRELSSGVPVSMPVPAPPTPPDGGARASAGALTAAETAPAPPVEPPAAVERERMAAPPAPPAGTQETPTVYVVPRLFPARERRAPRLAPAVRRVAVRLLEWADRAQDSDQ